MYKNRLIIVCHILYVVYSSGHFGSQKCICVLELEPNFFSVLKTEKYHITIPFCTTEITDSVFSVMIELVHDDVG